MPSINAGPGSPWLSSRTKPGERLRAENTNEVKAALRRGRLAVAPPLESLDTPGGTLIRFGGDLVKTTLAKSGTSGIPANANSVPGSAADVTLYSFDGTTMTAGAPTTAYNLSTTAVGANKWLILLSVGGLNFVIFEDC